MNTTTLATLQVEHRFTATPTRIFDAWLDPASAGRWLFATPGGEMVRVEMDARVGGRYVLVDRRDGDDVAHEGEYLEISRPQRLAFTFAVPKYSALHTTVTLDFTPAGDGCHLRLTHEGVLPEWAEPTRQGWGMILDELAKQLR